MINNKQHNINKNGHRIFFILILCLFGFCLVQAMQAPRKKHKKRPEGERVYLLHADELRYDMFGRNPDAQIVKGKVSFMHQGSLFPIFICSGTSYAKNSGLQMYISTIYGILLPVFL